MTKKYTGRYTTDASKALKGAPRLFCQVVGDDTDGSGNIYVTNGFVLYKLTPPEYAAVVQPVTCCEPGNWSIDQNGKREQDEINLPKLFSDAVRDTQNAAPLERVPLAAQLDNKTSAAAFYSRTGDFAAFYDTKYLAAFAHKTFRAARPISAAVAYCDDEPYALVLPIRANENASRAVRAYVSAPETADAGDTKPDSAETDALRTQLAQAQAEIARQAAELAALRQTKTPQPAEPKTAAELIVSRFAALDGVTATIKGAQTAAPVVWLTGDTERHADALAAAGAKWSHKKSAYYVRVA